MEPTTWIELDSSAYAHNLAFIRDLIGPKVRFCSIVKGNAYGHGTKQIVEIANSHGVNEFGVYSADEAFEVCRYAAKKPAVMVMGMLNKDQIEWAVENEISFFVFNKYRLEQTLAAARKVGKPALVHLEVETGMNRTGVEIHEFDYYTQHFIDHPDLLHWSGLCTHYAGAESVANYLRVKRQHILFNKLRKKVMNYSPVKPDIIHTACSAAALRYPATLYDLARIGILQYGFFPSRETLIEQLTKQGEPHFDPLKRLISWKSLVMDVKSVHTGEFVGYGTSYLATSSMRIANIPLGYAHGYARSLSNQGRVLIGGQQAKVVGMVNMNMIQADITNIPEVQPGDEVVLIGRQGEQELSVSAFGQYSDMVNYELLTRLPRIIPRKIVTS